MRASTGRRSRVPEVNLFARTRQALESSSRRTRPTIEMILIVVVLVAWAGAGIAIALLLGWHPQLGSGP